VIEGGDGLGGGRVKMLRIKRKINLPSASNFFYQGRSVGP